MQAEDTLKLPSIDMATKDNPTEHSSQRKKKTKTQKTVTPLLPTGANVWSGNCRLKYVRSKGLGCAHTLPLEWNNDNLQVLSAPKINPESGNIIYSQRDWNKEFIR